MLKPGEKLQRLLTLLITWAVLLALFLAYNRYFVTGQKEFLEDKGFRALAALSNELSAKFDQARSSTGSSLKLAVEPPVIPEASLRQYVDIYLKDAWLDHRSLAPAFRCSRTASGEIPLEWVREDNGIVLNVSCFTHVDQTKPNSPVLGGKTLIYTLNLQSWVREAFEALKGDFDDVLVADSKGHVLFQEATTGPRISDLKSALESTDDGTSKQNGVAGPGSSNKHQAPQKSEKPQPGQASSPSDQKPDAQKAGGFQELNEASALKEITLGDEKYELFSQPVRIILGNDAPDGNMWNLVVCGLRRTESLESKSHAVPYSTLIWAALIAVALFSLSWPLFKLHYMSNTERFRPRDGWYLILAIFLVATAAMVMLLNATYPSQAQNAADAEMRELADKIKRNFQDEIGRAFQQLREIRQDKMFRSAAKNAQTPELHGAYLTETRMNLTYPYFKIAFWSNCEGRQLLKFDVRAVPTPRTGASPFPFFKAVISDVKSSAKGEPLLCPDVAPELDAIKHAYLQPLLSPNTGEFAPVLAAPFSGDSESATSKKIVVQALTIRPLSLVDPVLPPGYEFAVVDTNCEVLFHSESIRNLKENFCEESKNNAEVQPWLFSGVDTPLDISYGGHTERAYITSLPFPGLSAGQAFLIVFQEPDRQLTLNMAIILVCSILMGTYFAIFLFAAVVHLLLRGPLHWVYVPRFVWPSPNSALSYVQLFAANGLMLLLFWWYHGRLYEAPALALTLAVALLSVLFVLCKLCVSRRVLHYFGAGVACVALLAFFGLRHSSETVREWRTVLGLLAAFGLVAVLLSGGLTWITRLIPKGFTAPKWVKELARKRFVAAYALAALSLIAAAALVPCIGFFKYAYDAVTELSLKRDQLILSQRLLDRRDRIRQEYATLQAPQIAKERLADSLDRYDKHRYPYDHLFTVKGEPALAYSPQVPSPPVLGQVQQDPCDRSNSPNQKEAINDWIEQHLARATLTFPANQIGSEMSRLGVASTGDQTVWEHSWQELSPRCFSLSWQSDSRLPGLSVTSSYPKWQGLGSWAYLCLVLLGVILVLWLMSLVKKIFFTDVEITPPFETVDWKTVEDIKGSSLVIGRAQSGKTERLKAILGPQSGDWCDVRVELNWMIRDPYYQKPSCQGRLALVLDHFDFNMKDRGYNLARLNLLESLLYENYDSRCKLVIVSTVDPLYFLTEGAPKIVSDGKDPEEARRLLDRWARALSKFTKVNLAGAARNEFQDKVGEFAECDPECVRLVTWIWEECGGTAFLRRVGIKILDELETNRPATRERLVSLVRDRADAYYHVLWSGLTANERLALYQLALDGWANPNNTAAIQQLERKQLICKAPMYRILNESFRKFVESTEHADEIAEWEKHEQQSTWRAFRLVLTAVAIGAAVWLLYAQAALFQIGSGYIAAIATLLTAVASLFSRPKRSAPADSGAAQSSP
jgi:hypothetical protein